MDPAGYINEDKDPRGAVTQNYNLRAQFVHFNYAWFHFF